MPPKFGQLVIGPPGSGKSTYCDGMHQFLSAVGRPCSIVNLDPANDHTSYKPALDVRSLVSLEQIMTDEDLGPNGSVLHALETIEADFDWLEDGLATLDNDYILFDCPGQVELFTHHESLRNIIGKLAKKLDYRLVVMHLVDSFVLTRPSLYISALLLSLRTMLQLDMPHINVLSKIDNLHNYPRLPFDLEFYTEVHDLQYLLPLLNAEQTGKTLPSRPSDDDPTRPATLPELDEDEGEEDVEPSKFDALNAAIVNLVEDFSLVGYEPLVVEDKASMAALLHAADKASGYAFGAEGGANDTIWQVAVRSGATSMDVRDVQERWIDRRVEYDAAEREAWAKEGEEWNRGEDGQGAGGEENVPVGGGEGDEMDLDVDFGKELEGLRRGMKGFDSGVKIVRKKPGQGGSGG
ncbi:ATP binding protein [Microthyrium microscopicum]|uniref:GPN-loop GTPase 2 n=1 Tax=Microthyrium microscopicum TaxID=703497 RepID=A0A6A6UJ65_9PEZI|nr:ATP binding protein [Microthyrium microscopicum]